MFGFDYTFFNVMKILRRLGNIDRRGFADSDNGFKVANLFKYTEMFEFEIRRSAVKTTW